MYLFKLEICILLTDISAPKTSEIPPHDDYEVHNTPTIMEGSESIVNEWSDDLHDGIENQDKSLQTKSKLTYKQISLKRDYPRPWIQVFI